MHMIKQICKSCGNKFLMVQESLNGEVIKNIPTYPKINICSHHICSRLHKSSGPLSFLPNFAIKACRIDFVYTLYFWFSFNCACVSFNHKFMYLYALSEMGKGGASLFFKIKVYPAPLDPADPLYHNPLHNPNSLHNICKRETGSRDLCVCGGGADIQ